MMIEQFLFTYQWVLLALSILVLLILFGLERIADQRLPTKLWHLAWLVASVMFVLSIVELVPHYVQAFQLPYAFVKVIRAIASIVMIYALIKSFFPLIDQRNKSG